MDAKVFRGKSVTLRALMRLLPDMTQLGGRIVIGGTNVLALPKSDLRSIRGRLVSMIF